MTHRLIACSASLRVWCDMIDGIATLGYCDVEYLNVQGSFLSRAIELFKKVL